MSIGKPRIPFESKYLDIEERRLHYFDEGKGETVLISHGIPEWSMLYVRLVEELSKRYRCIIPDHLGFGLSVKDAMADLSIKGHSKRLLHFAKALKLKDIHLYVHDLGGPIGFDMLISDPGLFKSLSISNTWCWSLEGTSAAKALKMMQGRIGKWLYLNYGFSVKFMAKNGFADKTAFSSVKDVFMYPHQTKEERYANYMLMLEMMKSGNYLDYNMQELKGINLPVQLIWGMKDKFFDDHYLDRWQKELPGASVKKIPEAGHFPQIEAPQELAECLHSFICNHNQKSERAAL